MGGRSIRVRAASAVVVLAVGAGLASAATSAQAAEHAHAKPKPVAVFIGDSFTQGGGASTTSHRFTTLIAKKEGWRSVNLGRGGTGYVTSSSAGTLSCGVAYCGAYGTTVDDAMAARAKVVIVSGGINDVEQPLPVFRSGVDQLFGDLKTHLPKRTFIAVTTPQWPNDQPPAAFVDIIAAVRASAKANGVHYLDIGQPLGSESDLRAGDGVHPNDAGHRRLAKAVERRLSPLHHP